MSTKSTIAVEQNPYSGTWDVGWKWDDGEFTPQFCGYATREEAEAEIPGFDERVQREYDEWAREKDAEEREQNERWPNIGYVRARIKKMKDPNKAFDAGWKLDALLDMDLHEHIDWPLPSWTAIKSRRVYGR
ncbi:hypothetical protein AB4Z51_03335 [Bradyrhizobium sp. 2TAF36]|uniref:hypothetical protein n=1 Tax=Bradyrhizobium sp. 2TAF36 TaxID=3233016 RepID=UPI003F8F5207